MGTTQLGIEGMRIAAAVGGMQGSGVEHHNLLHGSKIFAKLSPSQPSNIQLSLAEIALILSKTPTPTPPGRHQIKAQTYYVD